MDLNSQIPYLGKLVRINGILGINQYGGSHIGFHRIYLFSLHSRPFPSSTNLVIYPSYLPPRSKVPKDLKLKRVNVQYVQRHLNSDQIELEVAGECLSRKTRKIFWCSPSIQKQRWHVSFCHRRRDQNERDDIKRGLSLLISALASMVE